MACILPSDVDPGTVIATKDGQIRQRGDQLAIIRVLDVIANLVGKLQESCRIQLGAAITNERKVKSKCVCLFFRLILYVNCFGRTVLYMCIEYHI